MRQLRIGARFAILLLAVAVLGWQAPPDAQASNQMYWGDVGTDKIERANLDGSGRQALINAANSPKAIALDVDADKMYWAASSTIRRANLDGTGAQVLVTGLAGPTGIALDVAAGKMYWKDTGVKIQRANFDGTGVEDLVAAGLGAAGGIALDVAGGKMYWTDTGTSKIRRANLDGSGIEELLDGVSAYQIALDLSAGKMYWAAIDKIQRANLDGSGLETAVTGLENSHGVALDTSAFKIYWTDEGSSARGIRRANLDGSGVEDLVTTGLSVPRGIALDTVALYPGAVNGTKWDDQDGNEAPNGEPGIAGVEICIFRRTPPDEVGTPAGCTYSGANGYYEFLNLAPGDYRVAETVPSGTSQTFPPLGQSHFVPVQNSVVGNINFGNRAIPPGTVQGTKFNDTNGNGTQDGGELGVSGISICVQPAGLCTTTNSSGDYSLTVAPGNHTVYEQLPPGRLNTTPINVPVTVTSGGTVSGINFGNRIPVPPPPEVTVESNWSYNGIPIVGGAARTYTKDVTAHCEDPVPATPLQVKLVITSTSGSSTSQMMTNTSSEIWSATMSPPSTGLNTLRFYVDCPPDTAGFPEDTGLIAGEDEIQQGGNIYVDPSGTILDECTGAPLDGATVTLVRESPPGSDNFIAPASSSHIPADNPEITAVDGAYGWVVIPGTYRVRAEKAGYVTAESADLTIPPAVTDLNLTLGSATDADCDGLANAVDDDDDNDEVFDVDEGPCGADPLDAGKQPERLDTPADDDGDTVANEALPSPASDGFDCDGDGWRGDQENLIYGDAPGTARDQDPCGNNGWPIDLAANNVLNIADLNSFLSPNRAVNDGHGVFNMFSHALDDDGDTVIETNEDPPGEPGVQAYNVARWNLQTPPHAAATLINIGDLNALITGAVGSPARPPMFGGQQAFFTNGGMCPYAP